MNRVAVAMIAAGLVAPAAACRPAKLPESAPPSATEIVAKNAAARGGLDAWRKVATMVWSGHIESAHTPMPSMPFRLEQKRPNRTRLEITAVGERSVRIFNGRRGWKMRHGRGQPALHPYEPQELRFAQAGHGIDGPLLDYASKGSAVTLEGVDEVGGRKAYHLSVRAADGGSEDVWVDAKTFLDLRYDRTVGGSTGPQRRVSMTYDDYRTVEGLQVPFLITTGGGPGATPDKMRIETVQLNVPLDDAMFENPTAARGRTRAHPSVAARSAPAAEPEEPGTAPP